MGMDSDWPEASPELVGDVLALLAEVDAEVARRGPVCEASGRCCRFEAYGHRLYVTTAEAVVFGVAHVAGREEAEKKQAARVSLPLYFAGEKVEGCPYQVEGLCTARQARPLGCRVYFCDPTAKAWQEEVYERFHAQLKALHEKHGVRYGYWEWRVALRGLQRGKLEARNPNE